MYIVTQTHFPFAWNILSYAAWELGVILFSSSGLPSTRFPLLLALRSCDVIAFLRIDEMSELPARFEFEGFLVVARFGTFLFAWSL